MSFQKILHYTFKAGGEAFDISGHRNHGNRTDTTYYPNGIASGSGALRYDLLTSRVQVPKRTIWDRLGGLRIEMVVNLAQLEHRINLIEGDLSFAFFVRSDGVLIGTFYAPKSPSTASGLTFSEDFVAQTPLSGSSDPFSTLVANPLDPSEPPQPEFSWQGVNSDTQFAPDGIRRTVPLNTWVKLTYVHDGTASLRLFINDQLVGARYDLQWGVPSVQGAGIHVGQWPGDERYALTGLIDEVELWKINPDFWFQQFLCRPMTYEQEKCWRQVFANLLKQTNDPELGPQVIQFLRCIEIASDRFVRAIRGQGEAAINRSKEFADRYHRLWCSGQIDGGDMRAFVSQWQDWIASVNPNALPDYQAAIASCFRRHRNLNLECLVRNIPACDLTVTRFLTLIGETIPESGSEFPCSDNQTTLQPCD